MSFKRFIIPILATLISFGAIVHAAFPPTNTTQGGTGSTTPSGILYGDNGSTLHLNTVKIGSNLTFSGGTLSATGGSGGSGTVGTSTVPTVGNVAYWTSAGYPSLLGSVATSTLTATSPLTGSFTHVGSAGSLGIQVANTSQNGYLSSTDWNTFNAKQYAISTTTFTPGSDFSTTGTLGYLIGGTNSTLGLSTTGVTAGTYGTGTSTPQITVDSKGRITVATNVPIAVAGSKTYYAYATQATSSPAYYNMSVTASTTQTTKTYILANGTNYVQNWITATGEPGTTVMPAGNYIVDLYAYRSSGSASILLSLQVWEVSSTGADVSLIATTHATPNLTGTSAQYQVAVTAPQHTMASSNDRIVMRLVAVTTGTPTLAIAMGDGSPMDLVTPGLTVDTTNFVPYVGATKNLNLGAYNASTTQLTVSGNSYLSTIKTGTWNGSVIGATYGGAGTVSGILKANGSGTVSAAVDGTDYTLLTTTTCTSGDFISALTAAGGVTCTTPSGGSAVALSSETPSGTVNGSNVTFTVLHDPSALFVNGQYMTLTADYTYNSGTKTITFTTAPVTGSNLVSLYGGGAALNLTLTTTGTSGAATLVGSTLNIPQYSGGGGSGTVSTSSSETSGYIPYWTTTSATPAKLSGGTANFVWNAVHNWLGLGTSSPATGLTVASSTSILNYEGKDTYATTMTVSFASSTNQLISGIGTSATTVTLSGGQPGSHLTLTTCNGASTASTLTFSNGHYSGGVQPGNTTTANQCDVWSWYKTTATSTARYVLTGLVSGVQ